MSKETVNIELPKSFLKAIWIAFIVANLIVIIFGVKKIFSSKENEVETTLNGKNISVEFIDKTNQ